MKTMAALQELKQENETLTTRLTDMSVQLSKAIKLIDYYEHQFKLMKRKQFGASSERIIFDTADYRQMNLSGKPSEDTISNPVPECEEITYTRKKRIGKREEDLSNHPVERIDHELPETERNCPQCGETMHGIGADIRKELKLIPAKVVVVEHATHAYACKSCQKNNISTPVIKANAPMPLISGSLASPSLVAHIAIQKYSNGMPLYRLEKGFIYDGVNISRQTMSNWVVKCADMYLYGIYQNLIENLLLEARFTRTKRRFRYCVNLTAKRRKSHTNGYTARAGMPDGRLLYMITRKRGKSHIRRHF
jgi:transposase